MSNYEFWRLIVCQVVAYVVIVGPVLWWTTRRHR